MINNELIQSINKIHTTQLGATRIKRNLNLDNENIVEWCKNQILNSKSIIRKGKNWYIKTNDLVITVNAHSYTIITAHKSN